MWRRRLCGLRAKGRMKLPDIPDMLEEGASEPNVLAAEACLGVLIVDISYLACKACLCLAA